MGNDQVIACTLSSEELAVRGARWRRLGENAAVEATVIADGLRLAFVGDVGPEVRELAALERECCAFASWTVHTHGERVVLDITADGDEAVTAVQAMFGSLQAATR